MKRESLGDWYVFLLLVAVGVASRLAAAEWNAWFVASAVAPALFAGYYLSNRYLALLTPLTVMGISDSWLPAYDDKRVMLVIYAAVLLPMLLRGVVRRPLSRMAFVVTVVACVMASSIGFFLITNFAHWYFVARIPGEMGPGISLGECYLQAVPFYKSHLLGDLVWSGVLYGSYLLAARVGYVPSVEAKLAEARSV